MPTLSLEADRKRSNGDILLSRPLCDKTLRKGSRDCPRISNEDLGKMKGESAAKLIQGIHLIITEVLLLLLPASWDCTEVGGEWKEDATGYTNWFNSAVGRPWHFLHREINKRKIFVWTEVSHQRTNGTRTDTAVMRYSTHTCPMKEEGLNRGRNALKVSCPRNSIHP